MFLHRLVLVDRVDFSQRDIPVSFVQFTLYTFEFDGDVLQATVNQHGIFRGSADTLSVFVPQVRCYIKSRRKLLAFCTVSR